MWDSVDQDILEGKHPDVTRSFAEGDRGRKARGDPTEGGVCGGAEGTARGGPVEKAAG